jgi:hypothetical protein
MGGIGNALPGLRIRRRHEPQIADRRRGVADTPKGVDAVFAQALDATIFGFNDRRELRRALRAGGRGDAHKADRKNSKKSAPRQTLPYIRSESAVSREARPEPVQEKTGRIQVAGCCR